MMTSEHSMDLSLTASAALEILFARTIPLPQWNLLKEFNSHLSIVAEYFQMLTCFYFIFFLFSGYFTLLFLLLSRKQALYCSFLGAEVLSRLKLSINCVQTPKLCREQNTGPEIQHRQNFFRFTLFLFTNGVEYTSYTRDTCKLWDREALTYSQGDRYKKFQKQTIALSKKQDIPICPT